MPRIRIPYLSGFLPTFLSLALGCLSPFSAHAADFDPFRIEGGHWMSFDRYDDNVKRNRPVGTETLGEAPPKIETPELPPEPVADTKPADAAPEVAPMTRPINLPILPGFNKGFGVQIDSTLDSDRAAPTVTIDPDTGSAEMQLREQNWQDAAAMARQRRIDANKGDNDTENTPLDVRLSYLPDAKVVPATVARDTVRRVTAAALPAPRPTPAAKKAAECVAVDQYKKQQIEAIQSDRQTLQALQTAISELGLQKELNFLTGSQQSRTLTTPQTAIP